MPSSFVATTRLKWKANTTLNTARNSSAAAFPSDRGISGLMPPDRQNAFPHTPTEQRIDRARSGDHQLVVKSDLPLAWQRTAQNKAVRRRCEHSRAIQIIDPDFLQPSRRNRAQGLACISPNVPDRRIERRI